jgi:hypothetical protein
MNLRVLASCSLAALGAVCCGPVPLAPSEPSAPGRASSCVARTEPTHNDMPRNGLSVEALQRGYPVLAVLAQNPLNDDVLERIARRSELTSVVRAADNAKLLEYIASCALDRGAKIRVPDALQKAFGDASSLPGELGFCGARSPLGDWSSAKPETACLETVSACVLARVNALHRKVMISVRGEPDCLFPLQRRVPVETHYREDDGQRLIESFSPCSGDSADAARKCGWSPRHVGRCAPGTPVTLRFPEKVMARVCKGIHGCNYGEDHRPYAGHVKGGWAHPTMAFTCPEDGTFSVLVAAEKGEADPRLDASIVEGTRALYPAPEEAVFTVREGTFYGNIFEKQTTQHKPDRMLFGDQFVCHAPGWSHPLAHFADRLCADPDPDRSCFENAPVACVERCKGESPSPLSSFRACEGVGRDPSPRRWKHGVTVFLNQPCDLSRKGRCDEKPAHP